jgi:membrane protease YdiL (CAAX protease family)
LHAASHPLDAMSAPEAGLALVVGRTLDLRDAMAHAPAWERYLQAVFVDTAEDLDQAIAWYEELGRVSGEPAVDLRLAILEAEDGRSERVRERLETWAGRPDPFPLFAGAVEAAFLGGRPGAEEARELAAMVSGALGEDWFRDRIVAALGRQAGDAALVAGAIRAGEDRGALVLRRTRLLVAVQAATLVAGAAAVALMLGRRRRRDGLAVGTADVPPPWPTGVAVAVIVRGAALGGLALAAWLAIGIDALPEAPLAAPGDETVERLVAVLANAWVLPLLWLARRHLALPSGRGLAATFGLVPRPGRGRVLLLVTLAITAAVAAGDWAAAWVGGTLDAPGHWAEWFDEGLAFGSPATVAVGMFDDCVAAPVIEEIAFRGLLFGALRTRWGFPASALGSGALFAAAHGYGAVGLVSVLWSGVVWAWAYERTGSLLPAMIAHGLHNATVSLAILVLLR